MSTILGNWNINWGAFGAKFGPRNLDQLVLAKPPTAPGLPPVSAQDDFSAVVDDSRQACAPYLRVIPFGRSPDAISALIEDGDVLVFVRPKPDYDNPAEILKQRGWHAELCYRNDVGGAFERAPWGDNPRDQPCNAGQPDWIIHVFRLELPGLDQDRAAALKRQVRSWKILFGNYDFPKDGNPETGGHWFLEPADFACAADLDDLARAIIGRPVGVKPKVPPVTCVLWTYTVLCLALNMPLTRNNLERLGVLDDFSRHWQSKIVLADDKLAGIGSLPFVPYSPAQVLQAFLDTYMPGESLLKLLTIPGAREFLHGLLKAHEHPGLPERVEAYLDDVVASGDMTKPLDVEGRKYRFVMPIAFFCEARKPSPDPKLPWFRYIGTAMHNSLVIQSTAVR